jgi:hypothetical protein
MVIFKIIFSCMNFRYVCKKASSFPKLPSNKWPIHPFWRGLTALQSEMHLSVKEDLCEELGPRGENASPQKKLLFRYSFSTSYVLKMPISWKLHVLRVWKCIHFNSASAREIRAFLRYVHFVAKSQIVIFVLDKLGNFASRKTSLEPRFWMINQNLSTGEGPGRLAVKKAPKGSQLIKWVWVLGRFDCRGIGCIAGTRRLGARGLIVSIILAVCE